VRADLIVVIACLMGALLTIAFAVDLGMILTRERMAIVIALTSMWFVAVIAWLYYATKK